jgi:dTDP-glucose 4,6-dehydratase
MNILVTGGLGTVGAGLVKELRKCGHHVISCNLAHQPDEFGFSVRTDVQTPLYARCDVGEFRQVERVFDKLGPFDALVEEMMSGASPPEPLNPQR